MPLTRQQVREVDRLAVERYGMSGLVLMENAGRGAAEMLAAAMARPWGRVAIVCGRGNNGGDGFVIARRLGILGIDAGVVLLAAPESLRGDAATNFEILVKSGAVIHVMPQLDTPAQVAEFKSAIADAAWLVDAILGTGATGNPRPPLSVAVDSMNHFGKPIFAVDLPSGLDCDTGVPSAHTIRARLTCTFVDQKVGFLAATAAEFTGRVEVADIGAPRSVVEEAAQLRSS